jgi:hypothetical protein
MLMVVAPSWLPREAASLDHHGGSKAGLTTSGVVHILGSDEQEVLMPTISWEQALAERPRLVSGLSAPTAHRH